MSVEDELLKARERIHKLSDTVQQHDGLIREHQIKLELTMQQVQMLTTQTATREQLDAAVLSLGEKVAASVTLMTLQMQTISNDIAPLKKGIYWIIAIVMGAVTAAILALILRPVP